MDGFLQRGQMGDSNSKLVSDIAEDIKTQVCDVTEDWEVFKWSSASILHDRTARILILLQK